MRSAYYVGFSTAAAAACLLKAFHQRPNFYSATVYLSQSNACLLILTNLCLVLACCFVYGLQRLLYGPLRPIEIEQLSEKAWYAVLDTLLAMPSFREDVGGWLLTMFVLLLAGKVWGWIGEGRVEILEQQPPANPRLFHFRLATSLIVSVVFDLFMLDYCVETVMADPRPGMMVIFTFEFAILSIFSMFTLCRYGLSLVQMRIEKRQLKEAIEVKKSEIQEERAAARREATAQDGQAAAPVDEEPIVVDENEVDVPGWEEKRRYLFALELFTDFVKLAIYIVFFTVSITFNGLPMHIMRDVYMTFASFSKRLGDYVAYRKATSDMNTRYPDATTEEIRGDACIVCRESMVAWEQPEAQGQAGQRPRRDEGLRAKKLPCNHILHLRCLKAWLERQQVCPTCRRPVISAEPAAGQPGAPGGNAVLEQPGQPPGPRPGRARIFNLGPIRIGFLDGPGDQIQDIVNRMRNPQQAAQNPAVANAGGPNHLGLQVPYADGAAGTARAGVPGQVATTAPVQVQLMQMEQRLMQEAHNLGVEQQQLINLRLMEAELARLRAMYIPAVQPVGISGTAPGQPATSAVPAPQVLHGDGSQALSNGQASLPHGLTLPEGWTMIPLHRSQGGGLTVPGPATANGSSGSNLPPVQTTTNTLPHPTPTTAVGQQTQHQTAPTAAPPSTSAASNALPFDENDRTNYTLATQDPDPGPTDEAGSPLFMATRPPVTNGSPPPPSLAAPSAQAPTSNGSTSEPNPISEVPWSPHDWAFGDSNAAQTNGHRTETAVDAEPRPSSTTNGNAVSSTSSDQGKGKGRAVEVEDEPDRES